MTASLRVVPQDALVIVAALAQMHSDGLDRAMREDRRARDYLVGLAEWQTDVAYPARAEIAITLNAWICALVRARGSVAITLPDTRLYITLAALTRYAGQCRAHGTDAMDATASLLDGSEIGVATGPTPTLADVSHALGRLIVGLIGRSIAA